MKSFRDAYIFRTGCIHYVNANVPNIFEKALNSSEFKEWQKAMDSEIECLKKNNTWVIVDKPR